MTPPSLETTTSAADHSAVTLELANKESAEHMHGMKELFEMMQHKPWRIKAYPVDEDIIYSCTNDDATNIITIKTVHLVRHGQGFHNLMADVWRQQGREWEQFTHDPNNPYIMPELLDAPLTDKGRQQARRLQAVVQSWAHQPQLVVLSPTCRALQTGLIVFEHLLLLDHHHRRVPFIAHEMVREETGIHLCDQRRPVTQQAREFPHVDFTLISPNNNHDPLFRPDVRESKVQVGERIYQFLEWLVERPEQHIGVSSHSGWLLTLLNGVCECSEDRLSAWFQTGELRSVQLVFVRQES